MADQGSTGVTALAGYGTVEASGISGAAVDSDGTVTVTGMTAEAGYVEVPITYGGSNVTVRVDYTKVRDGNAAVSGSAPVNRSEEHTSELQSLMRHSYAVFCLKKKKKQINK